MDNEAVGEAHDPGVKKLFRLYQEHEWMEPTKLRRTAVGICNENASYRTRCAKLVALAEKLNDALRPQALCRAGCSHCCSLTTLIYRHEAVAIAEVSGYRMYDLPARPYDIALKLANRYFGTPCPFLIDQRCSVYEVRPLVCRLHHALNDDLAACDSSVPLQARAKLLSYDVDVVEMPYHLLVRSRGREPWGAIQQFFP